MTHKQDKPVSSKRWEYIICYNLTKEELNKVGADGWELVSVSQTITLPSMGGFGGMGTGNEPYFYFKRRSKMSAKIASGFPGKG